MARHDLIFRVFVSSDLIVERNALQKRMLPKLRAYCQEMGARFQAIDLRCGVSEEVVIDPVLAHLKPKLPADSLNLLTALVAAINNRAKLAKQEEFSEWKNQPPVPLDGAWSDANVGNT